jgi:iron complex outermembrane receptor protein
MKWCLAIPLLLASQWAMAQTRTITGKVTDSTSEPLAGVNVTVKGTSQGTITDVDGKFTLTLPDGKKELEASYIGFATQTIAIGASSDIRIKLTEELSDLEEVIVVGYGTMRKSDLTGAVKAISSDDFKLGSNLTSQQLMQGQFAGVNITMNSGKPGGTSSIRVRGGTSIHASNNPLYVVDGVPLNAGADASHTKLSQDVSTDAFDLEASDPLSLIDPEDIESINVLKDASATAIFGSRGANGVIIITTKKGTKGKKQINYGYNIGWSTVAKKLDVLNADEYRKAIADINSTITDPTKKITLLDGGTNTDWQDEIMRTGISQSHHVSLSNSTDNGTNYRASLFYKDQEGIIKKSGTESYGARVNLSQKGLNDRLTVNLNIAYNEQHASQAPISGTVGSEMGSCALYEAYVFNPTLPVRKDDGDFYDVTPNRVNPVSFLDETKDKRTTRKFIGNFSADYNFWGPLTAHVNLGYNYNNMYRSMYISKNNLFGFNMGGFSAMQKSEDYNKLLDLILKYKQSIDQHHIDAMFGYSNEYFKNNGMIVSAQGFRSDVFSYTSEAGDSYTAPITYTESNKLISFYGRVNYNYANRYLITGTVRRDGTSRVGEDNKWGIFPSAAASWRITQEDFWNLDVMNDFKVRYSWGITGNQEIGNYLATNTLAALRSGYIFGKKKMTIILPKQYGNSGLKWEETTQSNIGIDFGFLDSRIRGSFDWYKKTTDDLLLQVDVPAPSLINKMTANVGSVENKGFELELAGDIIRTNDWTWDISFNISHNTNKVKSLSNKDWTGNDVLTAPCQGQGLSGSYAQRIKEGYSVGTFWGRKFTGIQDGKETYKKNADGTDWIGEIGCAMPDATYGINSNVRYKNWTAGIVLRGSIGNEVYNCTANNLMYTGNLPGRNVLKDALTSGIAYGEQKAFSSRFVEDASFLRLDNLNVSYNFSVKSLGISHARATLSAQNLFVITDYSGLDPEVSSVISSDGNATLGMDYLSYPRARTFSIGINLTF